jgi:hypothetical protein
VTLGDNRFTYTNGESNGMNGQGKQRKKMKGTRFETNAWIQRFTNPSSSEEAAE